jgi:CheY-like chemotaxis protein
MPEGGHLTLGAGVALLDDHYQSLHPEIEPGEYAVIAVTDGGEGMTAEVAAHAFEPFYTTKEVGKGSGLGLSMVFGFVKQSNGHVSIYSEPGLGTTVRIYLPYVGTKVQRPAATANEESMPEGHETILVVEDDPFVRSSVIMRVKSLGYKVVTAVNGNDALSKLRADPKIDLLFTDIVMPGGMSGWELADLAQQIRPGLPVLYSSGYPQEALVDLGRASAQSIILTKPYRKVELAHRLREALKATSEAC